MAAPAAPGSSWARDGIRARLPPEPLTAARFPTCCCGRNSSSLSPSGCWAGLHSPIQPFPAGPASAGNFRFHSNFVELRSARLSSHSHRRGSEDARACLAFSSLLPPPPRFSVSSDGSTGSSGAVAPRDTAATAPAQALWQLQDAPCSLPCPGQDFRGTGTPSRLVSMATGSGCRCSGV